MSESHTMIFPHAFQDSLSFSDTNLDQLQLQQLASNNIAATGGGGGGKNHYREGSMAACAERAWGAQMELGPRCPRCGSTNTKFCYFNNYSLTQPRHFCRACRRTWTRGGTLRNVPVGPRRVQPSREAKRSTMPEATAEHQDDQAHAVE